MTDYTPTPEEVRDAWIGQEVLRDSLRGRSAPDDEAVFGAEFDRMIAAVERAAAVKALREAAGVAKAFADKAIDKRDDSDYPESHYGNRLDGIAWGAHEVAVSLRDRADRIESEEQA